jgi:hypothetical protein
VAQNEVKPYTSTRLFFFQYDEYRKRIYKGKIEDDGGGLTTANEAEMEESTSNLYLSHSAALTYLSTRINEIKKIYLWVRIRTHGIFTKHCIKKRKKEKRRSD